MSWSTVLTPWVVAQKIRAATLNLMVTAIQELQTGCAMELRSTSTQTIPNGTQTTVTMSTSPYYTAGSGLSASGSGITVGVAGRYLVTVYANFASNGTGVRFAGAVRNGASLGGDPYFGGNATSTALAGFGTTVIATTELSCNAGDLISMAVSQQQSPAAVLNTNAGCSLQVRKLA